MHYLLDTNIVAFLFRNHSTVERHLAEVGLGNCGISEVTLAELKYGAMKSKRPDYHQQLIAEFVSQVQVLSIGNVLDVYAQEKVRLEKTGNRLEDFDLLIGATAVTNKLTLVTNNGKHMSRIHGIRLEDWTTVSS